MFSYRIIFRSEFWQSIPVGHSLYFLLLCTLGVTLDPYFLTQYTEKKWSGHMRLCHATQVLLWLHVSAIGVASVFSHPIHRKTQYHHSRLGKERKVQLANHKVGIAKSTHSVHNLFFQHISTAL